jgi:hypothetical protein
MAEEKPHTWFKCVGEANILAYEQMGWMFSYPQYVGDFLIIGMEYRCCCREWEVPPTLIKRKYWNG